MPTLKLTLSRTLSVLRRTIGAGRFLAGRESVALDPQAAMWVDVLHFRQQLNACRQTALLSEFTRRAQRTHPDLIVAGGNCSAYAGFGDPYLPFRGSWKCLPATFPATSMQEKERPGLSGCWRWRTRKFLWLSVRKPWPKVALSLLLPYIDCDRMHIVKNGRYSLGKT